MCISADVATRIAPQHHMTYRFSDSPSGRVRHWERRRGRSTAPWFVRPLVILLAFGLMIVLAFRGVQYALRGRHVSPRANVAVHEDFTYGAMPFSRGFGWPNVTAHDQLAGRIEAMIRPASASVSAQSDLVPHVSQRAHIYLFP